MRKINKNNLGGKREREYMKDENSIGFNWNSLYLLSPISDIVVSPGV